MGRRAEEILSFQKGERGAHLQVSVSPRALALAHGAAGVGGGGAHGRVRQWNGPPALGAAAVTPFPWP